MSSFIVIGGDKRMLSTAKRLGAAVCGFEKLSLCNGIYNNGEAFSFAVLPPQKSPDGINIYCPDSDIMIPYNALKKAIRTGGTIFTGYVCGELQRVCDDSGLKLVNYLEREELAVKNAVLTAEGALSVIISQTEHSVYGAKILVTGYGRIAKILAEYLTVMGARVTVACRKSGDRAWAETKGCKTVNITNKAEFVAAVSEAEIIANTVPATVFGDEEAASMKSNALYIELASVNGVSSVPEAVKAVTARGLPGKTAPVTAGEIIADTILNILSEGRGS